jgi:hypothetical protein
MLLMRSFAEKFFTHFGAQLHPQDDELIVDLPPDLVDVFGQPRLYLVFPTGDGAMRELSPTEDLLVYGSRTFDQMLALLANRGETAQLCLPGRFPLPSNDTPALPLSLHNCRLLKSQIHPDRDRFYIFNFRAIYRSTEKQEALMAIVLDAHGKPRPDLVSVLAEADTLFSPDQPLPIELDTLRQMLDRAGEVAQQQANDHAAEMETAIQPRLEKTLLRLTTYYRRLKDEVDTGDAEQDEAVRADLQQDLAHQIADELERHQLRVTLSPISYALVLIPFVHYHLSLATRHSQQTVDFAQNLYTGQVEDLACHHCQQPLDHLALCDRQHLVHPHCIDACHHCDRDICQACGIDACAICHQTVCSDCAAACDHCDRWLCAQHVEACAICGAHFCTEHAFCCRWCGQTYCAECGLGDQCQTCRLALAGSMTEVLPTASIAKLELDHYHWRRAENEAYVVYMGQHKSMISSLRSRVVIVVNKSGQVVHWQKIGTVRWFLMRLK